jgi:hypothetical protein
LSVFSGGHRDLARRTGAIQLRSFVDSHTSFVRDFPTSEARSSASGRCARCPNVTIRVAGLALRGLSSTRGRSRYGWPSDRTQVRTALRRRRMRPSQSSELDRETHQHLNRVQAPRCLRLSTSPLSVRERLEETPPLEQFGEAVRIR